MSKVIEMTNTSEETVSVVLNNGSIVAVPPKGKIRNEEVKNLEDIRSQFKVIEALNEEV